VRSANFHLSQTAFRAAITTECVTHGSEGFVGSTPQPPSEFCELKMNEIAVSSHFSPRESDSGITQAAISTAKPVASTLSTFPNQSDQDPRGDWDCLSSENQIEKYFRMRSVPPQDGRINDAPQHIGA